jgi:hypothetical protein
MDKRPRFLIHMLLAVALAFFAQGAQAQTTADLAREEVAALAKPSVVRIVQHVEGQATIPALKIDLKNLSVTVDPTRPAQVVPVDEYLSGSGFIVAPNGYILTNSHVVSLQSVKLQIVSDVVLPAVFESSMSLSEEESKKLFGSEEAAFEFSSVWWCSTLPRGRNRSRRSSTRDFRRPSYSPMTVFMPTTRTWRWSRSRKTICRPCPWGIRRA